MSDTIAQLGLAVDSAPAARAAVDLDKLTVSSDRAEAATARLTNSSDGYAAMMQRMVALLVSIERDITVVTRAYASETDAVNAATSAVQRNTIAHRANGQAMANSRNLMFQLVDIGQGVPLLFQSIGYGALNMANQFSQIGQAYYGQGGFGAALRDMRGLLAPLLPFVLSIGAAAAAVAGFFAGLTTKINETAKTQVNLGEVFRATIEVTAGAIGRFFKPAIDQLAKWWQQFVDWFAPIFKTVGNGLINTFTTAFNIVKDTWSLLPDAFASIFTKAMNGAIDIVQNSINGIIGPVNDLLKMANLPTIQKADLSGFKGKPSNADNSLGSIVSRDVASGMKADPLGQAFGAISDKSQALALADQAAAADKAGKAMKAANDNAKLLASGLKDVGSAAALAAASQSKMVDTALGAFGHLSGALGKLFQDNKAFAISTAILQGLQGVAYALGSSAPPWNFINAAAVGVEAAANVANIMSTNQNSTSMPSSGAGAGVAAASAAASGPATAVHIDLHSSAPGSTYDYKTIESLLDALKQYSADGSTVITIGNAA